MKSSVDLKILSSFFTSDFYALCSSAMRAVSAFSSSRLAAFAGSHSSSAETKFENGGENVIEGFIDGDVVGTRFVVCHFEQQIGNPPKACPTFFRVSKMRKSLRVVF